MNAGALTYSTNGTCDLNALVLASAWTTNNRLKTIGNFGLSAVMLHAGELSLLNERVEYNAETAAVKDSKQQDIWIF